MPSKIICHYKSQNSRATNAKHCAIYIILMQKFLENRFTKYYFHHPFLKTKENRPTINKRGSFIGNLANVTAYIFLRWKCRRKNLISYPLIETKKNSNKGVI